MGRLLLEYVGRRALSTKGISHNCRLRRRNLSHGPHTRLFLPSIEKWSEDNGPECDIYPDEDISWQFYIIPIFNNLIG